MFSALGAEGRRWKRRFKPLSCLPCSALSSVLSSVLFPVLTQAAHLTSSLGPRCAEDSQEAAGRMGLRWESNQQRWKIHRHMLCVKYKRSVLHVTHQWLLRAAKKLWLALAETLQCAPCNDALHPGGEWQHDRKTKGGNPKRRFSKCGKANQDVKIKEHVDQKSSVLSCSKPLTWINSIGAKLHPGFWA